MKTKKLISMVDKTLELPNKILDISPEQAMNEHYEYAKFLKQPLTLGQFVPCDLEGNVLEKPKFIDVESLDYENYDSEVKEKYQDDFTLAEDQYQQALERILFVGCVYDEEMEVVRKDVGIDIFYLNTPSTIEDLVNLNLEYNEK